MKYVFTVLIVLFSFLHSCLGRQLPTEGAEIRYRLVGFSWPAVVGSKEYTVEIADGRFTNPQEFEKGIVKIVQAGRNRAIIEMPSFDRYYTWRVTDVANKYKSALYHFSCVSPTGMGRNLPRMRIINSATDKYANGYIFSDGAKCLFNMKGELVWAIPSHREIFADAGLISDMKSTKSGTISLIFNDSKPYEINYNGDVIWTVPTTTKDQDLGYHHEFTKTRKGNYMALGNERVWIKNNTISKKDSSVYLFTYEPKDNDTGFNGWRSSMVSTLLEFNKAGQVIWKWRFLDYYKNSDLAKIDATILDNSWDLHPNSFYYDEAHGAIYLSMRNVNRIIKISRATGEVLHTYGRIYSPGMKDKSNLFSGQHGVSLSRRGDIFLYDNEVTDLITMPKAMLIKENSDGPGATSLWEYSCTTDGLVGMKNKPPNYSRGGNVVELFDRSVFVAMNTPFSKVSIVDANKNVLWSAAIEIYNEKLLNWECVPQYRANILLDQIDLERIIFNGESELE